MGPNPAKGVQEVQISSGESMSTSEDMSSSEDSMDNRDSRANQKGRGQTPKLEFGPSRLEVVKEEQAARNKAAAKKKPEEKASSSSRGPAAMDTSLDQREDPATSLDKRDKPQIAIDHHNVLEVKGHIYPQSIRGLDRSGSWATKCTWCLTVVKTGGDKSTVRHWVLGMAGSP